MLSRRARTATPIRCYRDMSLQGKTLTQLRGIAQSYGISDIFQKDQRHLIQAIELKQTDLQPKPKIEIPKPEYDARLMSRPPSRKSDRAQIEELLAPYVARGLRLSFSDEQWFMACGKKTDEGTIRMPLKIVLRCAERILE